VTESATMTQDEFTQAAVEYLFAKGYNLTYLFFSYAHIDWSILGEAADPVSFAERTMQFPKAVQPAIWPGSGNLASTTAGAGAEWIAVHEAGHAIVAVKAGFHVSGIRFYDGDNPCGETGVGEGFERSDVDTLRRGIRLSVAGNVAESLFPQHSGREARLSSIFDDRSAGERSTDFCEAYRLASKLSTILLGRPATIDDEYWKSMRAAVVQAEVEAEQVLRDNFEALKKVVVALMTGPMTGTTVRKIIAESTA
jgi:hypothetical protein